MTNSRPEPARFDYESWEANLHVVGDEAYLPGERVPTGFVYDPDDPASYGTQWSRWRRRDPAYRERERQRQRALRVKHLTLDVSDETLQHMIDRQRERLERMLEEQQRRAR